MTKFITIKTNTDDIRINTSVIALYMPRVCDNRYAIEIVATFKISNNPLYHIYKFESKQKRDEVLAILDKKLGTEIINV